MIRTITAVTTALMLIAASVAVAEDEGWSADVGLSFSAQTGTTDTTSGTLDIKGARAWENDELDLRFLGTIGTTREKGSGSSDTTQNSQALFGSHKHTFTDRFFIGSQTELSRDGTQDREVRFLLNTGPGYRVWLGDDAAKEHFDVSAGVGYRYEQYDGNQGDPSSEQSGDNFADVVAAFEYKNLLFDGRIVYTHTGSARMPANQPASYILRTEATAGVPLSDTWDLRIGFLAEYVADVPNVVNGLTTLTTIGVGYKF